jgi:hypothetical protein
VAELINVDSRTVALGVALGLMVWKGDAYELTDKGREWLREWTTERLAGRADA